MTDLTPTLGEWLVGAGFVVAVTLFFGLLGRASKTKAAPYITGVLVAALVGAILYAAALVAAELL